MIAPDAGEAAGRVPALEELLDHLRVDLLKSSGAVKGDGGAIQSGGLFQHVLYAEGRADRAILLALPHGGDGVRRALAGFMENRVESLQIGGDRCGYRVIRHFKISCFEG